MPTKPIKCAGRASTFYGTNGELWCQMCKPTVKTVEVKLSAKQRQQLELLATVRGTTLEQVLRDALAALAGRKKGQKITAAERTEC